MRSVPHTDRSGSWFQLQVFVCIIIFVISWSFHHSQQISCLLDGCVISFIPSNVHPHPLSDSLSVSLCSHPPYYAARGGHRHQWGPNGSLGRLERGARKSAVASLSVLYLSSRVIWLDLSALKCVFVSQSEICWPHFLPSKPSHCYTFILMLHFHYCDTKCSAKH